MFFTDARAANTDIGITEIGAFEASGHEWIEIMNHGSSPVDLSGWKFWEGGTNHGLTLVQGASAALLPGAYAVIVQNDTNFFADYPTVTATVFDSSWGTLNESGEEVGLKDADGIIAELFSYIAAADFSLERMDPKKQDYTSANWKEHPDGRTPGAENFWNIAETDSGNNQITSASAVVINEFFPNPETGNEWIELYNAGSALVDLSGWTLWDGVQEIAALSSSIGANGFFLVTLSASKLNNTGDAIFLKRADGSTSDQVSYGNWDDGNILDNAIAPTKNNSLARSPDGKDTNIDSADFFAVASPTPKAINTVAVPQNNKTNDENIIEEIEDTSSIPISTPVLTGPNPRDIVINELVADPTDGAVEFVELYNNTAKDVDLSGWFLEEGSEARTPLVGAIPAFGFFVFDNPKGNLNNAGDIVMLYAPGEKIIDQVTYGTWDDGNPGNNAALPADPKSLARAVDGRDADNDLFDFVITNTVTKGKPNIISGATIDSTAPSIISTGPTTIRINELLPNPIGSDTSDEFIEFQNVGQETIDLVHWEVTDSSEKRYTIRQGSIAPQDFFLLKRSQSNIALNNTGGDIVKVYAPNGTLIDSIGYAGRAEEAASYARDEAGVWRWSTAPTPGVHNIMLGISTAPIVVIDADVVVDVNEAIFFDGSDTTDPDGDAMVFAWDFGDGGTDEGAAVEYAYAEDGVYTATLTVTDAAGNVAEQSIVITVQSADLFVGGPSDAYDVSRIQISEIFPNPTGFDTTEFIELFNPTDREIDLSHFKLDDEEGGSRGFVIPFGTSIFAQEYMVFGRQQTNIALNNTSDEARLLYPDGAVVQSIRYDDVPEGASYVQNEFGAWEWTSSITPGSVAILSFPIEPVQKTAVRAVRASSRRVKPTIETTIERIRDQDIGDRVRISGMVAVVPGALGSQIFYLVDDSGRGVQIYMFKKQFPDMAVGDSMFVTGEISEAGGETRLKVSEKADMEIVSHETLPAPIAVNMADIGESVEGALVSVHGEVTEIKSSYVYVDDGSDELRVYFKRGASIVHTLALGDVVTITGILGQTTGGYQLLPRSSGDMVKTGVAEGSLALQQQNANAPQSTAETYLTATAGGITSILIGLMARARGMMALGFLRKAGTVAIAMVRKIK